MPDPSVLLFALPLAFLAGFVDAIAGGGGVISIPTLYFMGLSPAQVVATNKLMAIFGGATASVQFWRKGHVDRALVLRVAPVALLGSVLGAQLVLGFKDEELFRNLIAALILLVGVLVVTNRKLGLQGRYQGLTARTLMIAFPSVFAIGVYDGFFGPGAGTFLMFLFVQFLYFDFVTGSGNARVINFVTNFAAFVTFLMSGALVWWIGLPMGIANALGAALGARMAILRGSPFVRVVYVGIVLLVVARLLTTG